MGSLFHGVFISQRVRYTPSPDHAGIEDTLISGDIPQNHTQVSMSFAAICGLVDNPLISFEGPFHQYKNVRLSVETQQQPHPPMWIQSRDAPTLRILAQKGVNTGYLLFFPRTEAAPRYEEYLRLWKEAGHPQKPNIGYWTLVYVDETDELAVKKATPHIAHAFSQVFGVGDAGFENTERLIKNYETRGEWGSAEIARNMANVEYLINHNLVFVGSPETVADRIKAAAAAGLFNTVFAEFKLGWLEEEDLMRSIKLFGEQVIPGIWDFQPY